MIPRWRTIDKLCDKTEGWLRSFYFKNIKIMGLMKKFSSSSLDKSVNIFSHLGKSDSCLKENSKIKEVIREVKSKDVNNILPDPSNYIIKKKRYIGDYLIIVINYPDCKNYEGDKILVFKNTTIEDLLNQVYIDPHFSDNKRFKSPIARFEPTEEGWELACKLFTI